MDEDPDAALLYLQWWTLRERLEDVVSPGSELPAPLAAYVVEWAGAIRLDELRALRDEFSTDADPAAEDL